MDFLTNSLTAESQVSLSAVEPTTFEIQSESETYTIPAVATQTVKPKAPYETLKVMHEETIANAKQTIAQLLSATEEMRRSKYSQLSATEGLPAYERLKRRYVSPIDKPKCLAEIPFPMGMTPLTIMSELSAIGYRMNDRMITQMKFVSAGKIEAAASMFTYLSGDKFVEDKEKVKAYLLFAEFIKNLDMKTVETNPIEVSYKILSEYIRTYKYIFDL